MVDGFDRLLRVRQVLRKELGREPTPEELAEHMVSVLDEADTLLNATEGPDDPGTQAD